MRSPEWARNARIGLGIAPSYDELHEDTADQESLMMNPRRAVPDSVPRTMGAFPRLTLTEADAGPSSVSLDPSLPMAPSADYETFSNNGQMPMQPALGVNPRVPAALPRLPEGFLPVQEDDPRAIAMNARIRELTRPGARYTTDEQMKVMSGAQKSVDDEMGGKATRAAAALQARAAHDLVLHDDRTRGQDLLHGDRQDRIAVQKDFFNLKVAHEKFFEQLGLRGQEFKEIAERMSISQRERGLTIQAAAEENRAIEEAARQAHLRGEAIPWANGVLAKLRYSVTGTPTGVMGELNNVPRPNLGIGPSNVNVPTPSTPFPEVNVPTARAPVQPGAQQEKAGPIGSDNEANVARRLYGDVSETALKKAHDLLVDSAAGNQRAKDILAGKIKRKAR